MSAGGHAPFTVTDVEVVAGPTGAPDRVDVRVVDGTVVAVGRDLARPGEHRIDAGGRALLPGLHDHHLHLLAMAAAARSLDVGGCAGPEAFDEAVQDAARRADPGWLRVVGWDERHGPLDRARLDHLAPDRQIRVQHRSGAAWVLSSSALAATGLAEAAPDGWLHRPDDELAARWDDGDAPDLAPVARRLAALGVTGVSDATPSSDAGGLELLADARRRGVLPQRVLAMGGPALAATPFPAELERGPVKVVISDHALPSPDALAAAFATAHGAGRPVAVHCVTRVAVVLALTAWEEVGPVPGDRIEHGSVLPVELLAPLAELGLTVVTQPGFVRARGDRYLAEVEPDDRPHLYRCGSLLAAGIGVGGSTDAPFGPDDPWSAIAAMADRTTAGGRVVGPDEAVPTAVALDRFLSPAHDPGGPARRVAPGGAADLVLVDRPLAAVLADPAAVGVAATWVGGRAVGGHDGC